eukprot:6068600-Amphidinium_carterae.1
MGAFLKRFAPGRPIPRPSAQRADRGVCFTITPKIGFGFIVLWIATCALSFVLGAVTMEWDSPPPMLAVLRSYVTLHITHRSTAKTLNAFSEAAGLEVEFTSPTQWQAISSFSLTVAAVGARLCRQWLL